MVLFTEQMYDRMGDQWASSFLAFLALACCAIPFAFWKYGARIRARSKYAYSGDDEETSSDEDILKAANKHHGVDPNLQLHDDLEDLNRARSYVANP